MFAGLRHELLLHSGRSEFVEQAVAFLRAGAAGGEAGLLLADAFSCAEARAALGPAAAAVTFVDGVSVGHNPARVLGIVRDAVVPNRRARVVAAPSAARDPRECSEILLHELTLSLPTCREWPVWLRCPYDTRQLDGQQLAAVRAAHPDDDGVPAAAERALETFATALPDPPADARRLRTEGDLASARRTVRRWAAELGLPDTRCDDLVVAVNEAMTNSLRHGSGSAEVTVWSTASAVICDVHDEGHFEDLLAGRLTPPGGRPSGRGVWMVNHLCDLVQLRSPAGGTTVRMTMHMSGTTRSRPPGG